MAAALIAVAAVGLTIYAFLGLAGHDDPSAFVDSRAPPDLAERFYPPDGWAWGLIQAGAGSAQRYGVAAPASVPRAQVLILPDYGETAETWFEAARDLTSAGDVVWILEGVGQGGSARLTGRRDLGDVASFDGDVAAARSMIDAVIRPDPQAPLVLLGQGVGALVAARAVETGAAPAGLVLSAPDCDRPVSDGGFWRRLGLGGLRPAGESAWRRAAPDDFARRRTHDAWRGAVTHAWQLANPDLRMGGPSFDWLAAYDALRAETRADVGQIRSPTLVLQAGRRPACLAPPGAEQRRFAGAGPALELEADSTRSPWLAAIEAFIAARTSRPPIPPLRSRPVTHLFKPAARL